MTKAELYQKACMLPLLPGVYIIRDKSDTIIYIGKAKRLRIRVSQYFREGVPHDNKVSQMIAHAYAFDVIVCQSEFEALVLEANHDVDMVRRGPYPQRLKQRILGQRGHLNNEDCARALCELAARGTRAVFLSHLSTDNNLPELAYNTVCGALSAAGFDVGNDIRVCVSRRNRVSDLLTLQTDEADAM